MILNSEVTEISTPYTELSKAYWALLSSVGTSATTFEQDMLNIEEAVKIDMQLKQLEQNRQVYATS